MGIAELVLREREGMTRFSLGGDEDGEGPSSPRHKKRRLVLGTAASIAAALRERRRQELQAVEEEESDELVESEEEESEEEDEEEDEEEAEGDEDGPEQPNNNNTNEPRVHQPQLANRSSGIQLSGLTARCTERTSLRLGSASGTLTSIEAPALNTRFTDRAIAITLTDPDVLDCPICCESLTVPVFQVCSQ